MLTNTGEELLYNLYYSDIDKILNLEKEIELLLTANRHVLSIKTEEGTVFLTKFNLHNIIPIIIYE